MTKKSKSNFASTCAITLLDKKTIIIHGQDENFTNYAGAFFEVQLNQAIDHERDDQIEGCHAAQSLDPSYKS